jgi:hypothetical protein
MTAPTAAEPQYPSERERKLGLEHHFAQHFDSLAFTLLADLYLQEGDLDRARKVCHIGLDHHPKHAPGLFLMATLALREGQMESAEALLLQTLSSDEYHVEAAELLVAVQERLKRKKPTLEKAYRRLLTANPLSRGAQDRLNRILTEKRLVEEVKAQLVEPQADALKEGAGVVMVEDQEPDKPLKPAHEEIADLKEAPPAPAKSPVSRPTADEDWSWETNIKRLAGMVATTGTTDAEIAPPTIPLAEAAESRYEEPAPPSTPEEAKPGVPEIAVTEGEADDGAAIAVPKAGTEIFETLADKERLSAESALADITEIGEDLGPESDILDDLDHDSLDNKELPGPEGAFTGKGAPLDGLEAYTSQTDAIEDNGESFEPGVETADTDTGAEGEVIDSLGIEIKEEEEDAVLPGTVFTSQDEVEVKPEDQDDHTAKEHEEKVGPFEPGTPTLETPEVPGMDSPAFATTVKGEQEEEPFEPADKIADADFEAEGDVIDSLGIEIKEEDEDAVLPGVVFTPEDEVEVRPEDQEDLTAKEHEEKAGPFEPGAPTLETPEVPGMDSPAFATIVKGGQEEEPFKPADEIADADIATEGDVIDSLGIETKEADEDIVLPGVVFTPEDEVEVRPEDQEDLMGKEHEEKAGPFEPGAPTLDTPEVPGMDSPALATPESITEAQEFRQSYPEAVQTEGHDGEQAGDEAQSTEHDIEEELPPGASAESAFAASELESEKTPTGEEEDASFEPGIISSVEGDENVLTTETRPAEDWRVEDPQEQSGVEYPHRDSLGEQEIIETEDSDTVETVYAPPLATDSLAREEEISADPTLSSLEDVATRQVSFEPGTVDEQDDDIPPEDSLARSTAAESQVEQIRDFEPGTASISPDEPSQGEVDLDLPISEEDTSKEELPQHAMGEDAGVEAADDPPFQPGTSKPDEDEPIDDSGHFKTEQSAELDAIKEAYPPESVTLEQAAQKERDTITAIMQDEEEPPSHGLEPGASEDMVPESTEPESELLVDISQPTESFEPGEEPVYDKDETSEAEKAEELFSKRLEKSKESYQPDSEAPGQDRDRETGLTGTDTDDSVEIDEDTEGGHDFYSDSDIELTDSEVELGDEGLSAEAGSFEPGALPDADISEPTEDDTDQLTGAILTDEEVPFQPGEEAPDEEDRPADTDLDTYTPEPSEIEVDHAQPDEGTTKEEQAGPEGVSPDSTALEGKDAEEARFEPGSARDKDQRDEAQTSEPMVGRDESELTEKTSTWSDDIPGQADTAQRVEPDQAILDQEDVTDDPRLSSEAESDEGTSTDEVSMDTVRMEDKDVEKVPFEPGDQEEADAPAALKTDEGERKEEPYQPDAVSMDKEADREQDTLERVAYDDRDMEGERFEASTAPLTQDRPTESQKEDASPPEESSDEGDSPEAVEPGDALWIDPKLATFTLATIYKVQGLYHQALQVLDMLEAKGGDPERIQAERESIIQQMTSGSQPE